jgi:putative ABC transport system substrate-binding protein
VELAADRAVPVIYLASEFAVAGGLVSYGLSISAAYRQAGIYVGKILKGAKPADLSAERLTKFELVVNLRTAVALGLTIPASILIRADNLIR